MEVPVLETLHIVHVLEQLVRGCLTGGNSNRWRTHVLCNVNQPPSKNVTTFFYHIQFQQHSTVHLHMLVWLEEVSSIRADLMQHLCAMGQHTRCVPCRQRQKI